MSAHVIDAYTHCGLDKYEPIDRVREMMTHSGIDRAVLAQHLGQYDNRYIGSVVSEDPEHFAVTTTREESDLTALETSEVRRFLGEFGVELVVGVDGVEDFLRQQRYGVEVWKPLVAIVLLLAFFELFLVRWIERGRGSTP